MAFIDFIPLTDGGLRIDVVSGIVEFALVQRPRIDSGAYIPWSIVQTPITQEEIRHFVGHLQDAVAILKNSKYQFYETFVPMATGGIRLMRMDGHINIAIIVFAREVQKGARGYWRPAEGAIVCAGIHEIEELITALTSYI